MLTGTRAVVAAWAALVVITLLSLSAAESSSLGSHLLVVIVVLGAVTKGAIVLVRFMGAGRFPRPWQAFFAAWLVVNSCVIIGFHLTAHG